jgi:hypothetical protein
MGLHELDMGSLLSSSRGRMAVEKSPLTYCNSWKIIGTSVVAIAPPAHLAIEPSQPVAMLL